MSQPDTQTAGRTRRPRDPRIDLFRGLLLVMIFIDHVPGNWYEYLTLRNIGFTDAAESFFAMSGMAAGLAYTAGIVRWREIGVWSGIAPVWKRAWVLYLSHVFLTMAGIAIFAAAAEAFGLTELLTKNNLRQVFENTSQALLGIVTMGHQIGYVNILPAYSVLLLAAPFAIHLALRSPLALLAGSLALWFATGLFRLNIPAYPNPGGWFFNPFAWQLIFTIGLLTGVALRDGERFVRKSRVLFALAAGWLVFVFAWRYVPEVGSTMNGFMARLQSVGLPFHITSHDKTYLPMLRLLHVLSLIYVISCLPVIARISAHRFAEPLRLMGRQGLLVFSAGTLLSLAGQALLRYFDGVALVPWLYIPAGTLALWGIAWLGDWKRRASQPAGQPPLARDEPLIKASSCQRRSDKRGHASPDAITGFDVPVAAE
ncbi:OpgC domain-containing protein [Defluviimonas sp. WL0024]|uniref:OpgC domain-containing protein n=1 Tax=Albidovulum salinarum TaxID=2984153 RepID=A0ABT2X6T8_9RHOB|nr:OpgC domain-containing protein [Defluviimonas sp. WL0024]MCU9849454.1 OpgC domain-containing protein [Defluviimonas sp. WL0024]